MGFWTKYFLDTTTITATDEEVAAGKASWSKSRLDGMSGASLSENGRHIAISGPGEYWQSDEIEVDVGMNGPGKIIVRRVMKKLDVAERLVQVLRTEHSVMLRVIDVCIGAGYILPAESVETIPIHKAGQWIILEYNLQNDTFWWYCSPTRI